MIALNRPSFEILRAAIFLIVIHGVVVTSVEGQGEIQSIDFDSIPAGTKLVSDTIGLLGDTEVSGNLTVSGLNCTANANGGALTADANGVVSCSDDESGGGLETNTLDAAYDQGGAGAGRTIIADSGAVQIEGNGGLEIDTGNLLQTPGDPVLVGSLSIGAGPVSVYVSGRYAYVVGQDSDDLKVIDVSDPSAPIQVGSLGIGTQPVSVYVSGRYAYVVDQGSNDLKVIDVSDPSAPSLAGNLPGLELPVSVSVSGRYAYVVDFSSVDLRVIDVSDPSAPSLAGSVLFHESFPRSAYVSGRYAYIVGSSEFEVIDVSEPSTPSLTGRLSIPGSGYLFVYVSGRYAYAVGSSDLRVIDVSDPSLPSLVGNLPLGIFPKSVHVSGRYAYVVGSGDLKVIDVSDPTAPSLAGTLSGLGTSSSVVVSGRYAYAVGSSDLKVVDVSGAEVTSLIAHSLEAGNVQVRNDMIAQGQLQVTGGINVGAGGLFSDGNVGVNGNVEIGGDLVINGSCSGCTSDQTLKKNIQPLTNALEKISLLNGIGFEWTEGIREAKVLPRAQIGVIAQEVEEVFPELVGTDSRGYKFVRYQKLVAPLIEAVKELKVENEALKALICLDHPQVALCQP